MKINVEATNGGPKMKLIDAMVSRFLGWKLPDDFMPDAGITFTPSSSGWPTGTNLLTADQAKAMLEHVLDGYETFRNGHDAAVLYERACYHMMQLMLAYERRIVTDLTPEQIVKKPWECHEYVAAANFLRRHWQGAPAPVNGFVGTAWLIETEGGIPRYYCGPGEWCDNPNHAMKFPTEQAVIDSDHWRNMVYPGHMKIVEHEWVTP